MNQEKIQNIISDELEYSGLDLTQETDNPTVLINRTETRLLEYVKAHNPNVDSIDKLPQFQQDAFHKALIEQIYYEHEAGDTSIMLGYDPVTGAQISKEELDKRTISSTCHMILENAGLLYAGIKANGYASYHGF